MVLFVSPADLLTVDDPNLGVSPWFEIDAARVETFADATGDHQWIHIDPVRAADGPFGVRVAHGFLTLSLCSTFIEGVVSVEGCSMAINYGLDRVRFPSPVPVNSRVRGAVSLQSADRIAGGVQAKFEVAVEVEAQTKPACVAEFVVRYVA